MAKILLVEDNRLIREAVTECFAVSGHHVVAVDSARRAIVAAEHSPDAIILDIRLPDGSGYDLARRFRSRSDVPVIFLTAKDSESERILGFEVGADDYVVKPFSAKELVLRVEAVLRRYVAGRSRGASGGSGVARWTLDGSELRIDADAHRAYADGVEVRLTESEWRILCALTDRVGQAVTREWLLGECLDRPYDASERTIDTHVANLRSRLGRDGWVETVRGYGYRFAGRAVEPQTGSGT